jgi:hypothetical protein
VFLLVGLVLGVASGFVRGGRLTNLTNLRIRFGWVIFIALLLQIVAFSSFFQQSFSSLVAPVYILSEVALLAVLGLNIKVDGLELFFFGVLMNLAAIVANGGFMPVESGAMLMAGRAEDVEALKVLAHSSNSVLLTETTRLPFLADIFAVPASLPLANVFSLGDVFLALGVFVAVRQGMLLKATSLSPAPSEAEARPATEEPESL